MKKSFSKIFTFIALTLLAWPGVSLATGYGLETTQEAAGLPTGNVPTFLGQVAGAALALAGSIFLFLIIYGGIMIMTSAGTDRVAKGQKIITYAIIGAVLLGAAYAITALVFSAVTGGSST
jgi:hypothetical protein